MGRNSKKNKSKKNKGARRGEAGLSTGSAPAGSRDSPANTTRVISENPRVVVADDRLGLLSPVFLYLPPGKNDMVFIDCLPSALAVASWSVWDGPPPLTPPPCFRIAPTSEASKGLGMFATRAIRRGELIAQERPLYMSRNAYPALPDQNDANGVWYTNAVSDLSDASRQALMALHNAYPPTAQSGVHELLGMLRTNFLRVDTTPELDELGPNAYVGCFPTLSRANHSCAPNTNYFFSFPSFVGQFWATRDIAEGEEITITYTELERDREDRRAYLRTHFFFTCACEVCSLPAAMRMQSDERRRKLGSLFALLELPSTKWGSILPAKIEEALRWAEEEKLEVIKAQLLFFGVGILTERESHPAVVLRQIRMAQDAYAAVEGETSFHVIEMNALILSVLMSSMILQPSD